MTGSDSRVERKSRLCHFGMSCLLIPILSFHIGRLFVRVFGKLKSKSTVDTLDTNIVKATVCCGVTDSSKEWENILNNGTVIIVPWPVNI